MSMPSAIVENLNPNQPVSPGTMGSASSALMAEQFEESPIIGKDAEMTDASVKDVFKYLVMRGTDADQFIGDPQGSQPYYAFEEPFNRNYVGYGDLVPPVYEFEWKESGDPTNSFVPYVGSSPGASPYTQNPPPSSMINSANESGKKGSSPFVGLGTLLSPKKFTDGMVEGKFGWGEENAGETLGMYLMGTSDISFNPAVAGKGGGPNAGMDLPAGADADPNAGMS